MEQPEFMVMVGKSLDTLTAEQAATALAPALEKLGYVVKKPPVDEATTNPIKEVIKPVAGHPRTQIGTIRRDDEIHGIFIGTGMPGLLEVVSKPGEPDAYVDKGYNLEYDLLPGFKRPVGPMTDWAGNDPVPGAGRQAGYRLRFFPDERAYWEQSDQPDEAPPVREQVKPVTTNPQLTHVAHYGLA